MPVDLSSLTIPPVSVVPEPTPELAASIISLAATAARNQGPCGVDKVLFSLARRCRELEAEIKRLGRQMNCGAGDSTCNYPHGVIVNEVESCAACAIQRLEAESERLGGLLVEAQSEAAALRETARAQQTGEWSATALTNHPTVIALLAEVERLRSLCGNYGLDLSRCEKFPKGEQCSLREGHEGSCRWWRGD